jgi:hypothetical protein
MTPQRWHVFDAVQVSVWFVGGWLVYTALLVSNV